MPPSKVVINLSLFAIGILALQGTAFASFPDVPENHVNYDAIIYVQQQGMVSGYPDGTYKPSSTINRAEFVKILIEAVSQEFNPAECHQSQSFPDVKLSDWFNDYVCIGKDRGYIGGYPDGTFKPSNSINFVEASKIIAIAMDLPLEPAEGTEWYRPFVVTLEGSNAIPTSINTFDHALTRGEMAEIMYRLKAGITNKPSKTYDDLAHADRWVPFQSAYFTLSFSTPSGFEVKDSKNYVAVAQSPYYTRDIGDDNAFMMLTRYDQYHTREGQLALYRKLLKNIQESQTIVDGSSFLTLKGDDWGRFEGDSAGKVAVVFFDASSLEMMERPANSDQNFDPVSIGEEILSTFRFSK
jgi:hypothetical protein